MTGATLFWVYTLGLTTLVELVVWKLWLQRPWAELVAPALAVNATTVPLANFAYQWANARLGTESATFFAVEAGVVVTETFLIRELFAMPWRFSAGLAAAANVASGLLSSR